MSDNTTELTPLPVLGAVNQLAELPAETVTEVARYGAADPVYLVTANGEQGLQTQVIDIVAMAPDAFPPRTVEPRSVTDVASFIAELDRRPLPHSGEVSTVWANRRRGTITAVYDDLDPDARQPLDRRADRLVLQFVADPDWAALFKAADGNYHRQEEFGDLIETAGHLVTSHPAADLIEIVDSIRASSKGSFESRISRRDGSQVLNWAEEVTATAKPAGRGVLEIPREIVLTAAPFESYPPIEVRCWLRLRIQQGALALALVPQPYEPAVRAAWLDVVGDLSAQIGRPIYAANLP